MNPNFFIDQIDKLATMPKPAALAPGLNNLKAAIQALGLQKPPCPLITVAGTNGKGSSVAYLEYCYTQAGFRVASYTSPHLYKFNERIRFNAQPIDNETLKSSLLRIESVASEYALSFFELTTLMAFDCFANRDLDVVIAEVGLGGRLDAVNAFDCDVALITSIDLDHQQYLGHTREAIGLEKAGIMRKAHPVVCADPNPPLCIQRYAETLGAQLTFSTPSLEPTLIGQSNAGGCQAVVNILQELLPVSEHVITQANRSVNPPGRLTHLQRKCDWVVDVAHNPAAMRRLAEHLRSCEPATKTYALIGMCQDKDIQGCLIELKDLVDEWHVAPFDNERSAQAINLSNSIKAFSNKPCYNHTRIATAAQELELRVLATDRVVVCGSFFTVGELEGVTSG